MIACAGAQDDAPLIAITPQDGFNLEVVDRITPRGAIVERRYFHGSALSERMAANGKSKMCTGQSGNNKCADVPVLRVVFWAKYCCAKYGNKHGGRRQSSGNHFKY